MQTMSPLVHGSIRPVFEVAAQLHVDEVATNALLQWSDVCGLRPELCATYAPLAVSEGGRIR